MCVPIPTIIVSAWLNHVPTKYSMFRACLHQGVPLGCMLVPLVISSLNIAVAREGSLSDCLGFYLRAAIILQLSTVLASIWWRVIFPYGYICWTLSVVAVTYGIEIATFKTSAQSVVCMLVIILLYVAVALLMLQGLPGSFTAGEAIVVATGLSLVFFDTSIVTLANFNVIGMPTFLVASRSQFVLLLETVISWLLLLITMYAPGGIKARMSEDVASKRKWSLYFYEFACGAGIPLLVVWLSLVLKMNALYWGVLFVQSKQHKAALVFSWVCCIVIALRVVSWRKNRSSNDNEEFMPIIVVRKLFHFIASAVFVTGLLGDVTLLHVSCTAALTIFILIEVVRSCRLWPIGETLHYYMSCLTDSRDSGHVILTHIYLLVGLALPIWLVPSTRKGPFKLAMYAGVLSLGVGDSFASIFGKWLGRRKWPNSTKSLEGTLACMMGQIVAAGIVCSLDSQIVLENTMQAIRIVVSLVLGSLLEGMTVQIDNLVLPLYTLALLLVH
ncbi:dolichol kinase-like isoform X2 [Corticium candelabrum]|uniref:dolichol kinase-like isoform X2 n=1 Tax=Corticium candelabrum TaxID=121492 RepID=UPI002E25D932|nr:dolichol kinase-like isoform X2 [Corticium candelabrum]